MGRFQALRLLKTAPAAPLQPRGYLTTVPEERPSSDPAQRQAVPQQRLRSGGGFRRNLVHWLTPAMSAHPSEDV